MGLGDSVPGISGGTIAVITKIYDQLVFSIRAIDLQAGKLLFSGRVAAAWQHVNGSFLLILALGILSGLLVSANTVLFLLENYFPPLMAFFIGMVLSSIWLLRNEFSLAVWQNVVALLLGLLLTLGTGFISPRSTELSLLYIFFSGALAVSAMILPGLSGAFILLLLGVYKFILDALVNFNWPYIFVFGLGCAVGLLAFSRVLSWLLRQHHQLAYGFIVGMLSGSVSALWPWQHAGQATMGMASLLASVFGVVLVVALQIVFVSNPLERSDEHDSAN